ncbi:MAG: aacA [Burkholderiales bacterium]|jgi:RimJ/RimL family protein N-acetyltransferase|nr:aacA [Burkholderiales bacterium]
MAFKNLTDSIHFEKAGRQHQQIIFAWLAEPHIQEFWDNSQEHKEDIINFIHDRQQHYFYGTTRYWIGFVDNQPFCFLLTDQLTVTQTSLTKLHRQYLSKTGHTITLDFGIGNKAFLGKGLAAPTLEKFIAFYNYYVDPLANTFFIDPDENNSRAQRVYEKAGFKKLGAYEMKEGAFTGQNTYLMVKELANHCD